MASNAVRYDSWPVAFIAGLGLPETAETDDGEFEGMKAPRRRDDGKRAIARAAVATNHTTELDPGTVGAPTSDRSPKSSDDAAADLLCLWADAVQPISDGERLAEPVGSRVEPLSEAFHCVTEGRPTAYRAELRAFLTENDR